MTTTEGWGILVVFYEQCGRVNKSCIIGGIPKLLDRLKIGLGYSD